MRYTLKIAIVPFLLLTAGLVAGFVQENAPMLNDLPAWVKILSGSLGVSGTLAVIVVLLTKYIRYKDTRMEAITAEFIDYLKKTSKQE